MAKAKKKRPLRKASEPPSERPVETVSVTSADKPRPAAGELSKSSAASGQLAARIEGSPNADEKHRLLYQGASGQMAVMSEFLFRLINVAVPEVDVGDDVFVVREKDEAVTRVQVKYAAADEQQNGEYVAQFSLPWKQLDRPDDTPALVYVLAVRYKQKWTDFIVVRRSVLRQLQAKYAVGSIAKKDGDAIALALRLVFTKESVKGKGKFSFQPYRNAFDPWPPPQLS
jgi:hypothetical protein